MGYQFSWGDGQSWWAMTDWMKTKPSITLCHLWICSHLDHTYEKTLWFMYLCLVQMLVVQEGNGKDVDLQTHHYLNLFHTNTNINQAEDYKTFYQARKMFWIRREMQLPFSISLFTKCTEWYTFIPPKHKQPNDNLWEIVTIIFK